MYIKNAYDAYILMVVAIRIVDCDVHIRNAYDAHILFSVNAGKLYR